MLLRNVFIAGDQRKELKQVLVKDGIIQDISIAGNTGITECIDLDGALLFPGLINSHDHLDFNLFPQLGNRIYHDYTEWGNDIHATNKEAIEAVLAIPLADRIQWGIYKNLLNGVTTVVNHGAVLNIIDSPVDVHQQLHSLHSVAFEFNWKWKLNRIFPGRKPFVIHTGEGTSRTASAEIDTLLRWNLFNHELIAVHGVSMTPAQARLFKALVWCPASNIFMLGTTARVNLLKRYIPILFGSDSTLSAEWNLWNHIRLARETGMLSDRELFESLTATPASIWGLNDRGKMAPGFRADIVAIRTKKETGCMDAFCCANPEDILLVLQKGQVRLFDASLHEQVRSSTRPAGGFSAVHINEQKKHVTGRLAELVERVKSFYPSFEVP